MSHIGMFIPITKVDAAQRLVYGIATAEIMDRAGEICDYESTKPHYQNWSDEIAVTSGGKSLGNLRAMHGAVAAGKVTALTFNDDDKQIEICAKVVDDDEWRKVQEGVYTGFSQGGSYVRRWTDENGLTRYTASPSEISLVDLPCLAEARFEMVKYDGTREWRPFVAPQERGGVATDIEKIGARNSEADLTRIQSMHDSAVELGATCDGSAQKMHGALDSGALEKRFDNLATMLADILARVKKIEDQPLPLPLSGRTRAISKQEDGRFDGDENAAIEKLLGDPQALSLLAIKLAQQRGRTF
jgi:hypothetical protein